MVSSSAILMLNECNSRMLSPLTKHIFLVLYPGVGAPAPPLSVPLLGTPMNVTSNPNVESSLSCAFYLQWFWRITEAGVMEGHPVETRRFWYGLPPELDHIDAVYERVGDSQMIFFSGD